MAVEKGEGEEDGEEEKSSGRRRGGNFKRINSDNKRGEMRGTLKERKAIVRAISRLVIVFNK